MTTPARQRKLPEEMQERALATVMRYLETSYRREPTPVEPYASAQRSPADLAKLDKAAAHGLDGEAKELHATWHVWRMAAGQTSSENQAKLLTLLWAQDMYRAKGDDVGAGAITAWLAGEWGVTDVPEGQGSRYEFASSVCAPDVRRGSLDPTGYA